MKYVFTNKSLRNVSEVCTSIHTYFNCGMLINCNRFEGVHGKLSQTKGSVAPNILRTLALNDFHFL